jgi:hypothetical protein
MPHCTKKNKEGVCEKKPRCPNGTRRDKNGDCVPKNNVTPKVKQVTPKLKQVTPIVKQVTPKLKKKSKIKQPTPIVKQPTPIVKQPTPIDLSNIDNDLFNKVFDDVYESVKEIYNYDQWLHPDKNVIDFNEFIKDERKKRNKQLIKETINTFRISKPKINIYTAIIFDYFVTYSVEYKKNQYNQIHGEGSMYLLTLAKLLIYNTGKNSTTPMVVKTFNKNIIELADKEFINMHQIFKKNFSD